MRRELTRGGIFLCACVSAQHRDNWGGTPGHRSPLNPAPLPFKPTASTLGAHFVHMCVCVLRVDSMQPQVFMYVGLRAGHSVCCADARLSWLPLHSRLCGNGIVRLCVRDGSGKSSGSFSCAINDSGPTDNLRAAEKLSPFLESVCVCVLLIFCCLFHLYITKKAFLKFCLSSNTSPHSNHKLPLEC